MSTQNQSKQSQSQTCRGSHKVTSVTTHKLFYYNGLLITRECILEFSGVYPSLNINTAKHELVAHGLQIIDLRPASYIDIRLDRLKKLKGQITPLPPKPTAQVLISVSENPEPAKSTLLGKLAFWRK
jgi:hypothetical protein